MCETEIDNKIQSEGECSNALQEVALLGTASSKEISDVQDTSKEADNHTVTISNLQEQVIALRKELCQMQQNVLQWKRKYMEVAVDPMVQHGECVVKCADKAVEDLMHLEDRYVHVSAWCSEKACKEYQNAIALSIWTNESTFYANLCHLLIVHMKCHLRQMVFHPAKILMQMDLAGGTLSMEGLEVIRMCETDGEKYVHNTIICSSADIKRCCANVDKLSKRILPYEHGHLYDANGGGEFIQWEPRHMMVAMISAYELSAVVKE